MRRFALVAAVLALCISACSKKGDIAVGLYSPDFAVADAGTGASLSSKHLKGKVLFVNFWASWCPPCKEEMPSIQKLYEEMKVNPDFVMITILYNDDAAAAREYLKTLGFTFPVYTDAGNATSRKFGLTGVPETYIVDKEGILRKKVIGATDWSSQEEKDLIYSLLKK